MQYRFRQNLDDLVSQYEGKHFLVAFSGGIDSAVMLDLFAQIENIHLSLAHCNFKLRGEESDQDEAFAMETAEKYHCKVFINRFDTMKVAEKENVSVQMAARKLRYDWFNNLVENENMDFIAVGHNKNDLAETFFINLLRGTGIRGLTSIKAIRGNIIRPLLQFERAEIEEYARYRRLEWREDSSNKSSKYDRNKLRHEIFPRLTEINPSFLSTMEENMDRLQQVEKVYREVLESQKSRIILYKDSHILISLKELRSLPSSSLWIFEILKEYGFTGKMIRDIEKSIDSIPGKVFYSGEYELTRDRDFFILRKKSISGDPNRRFYIEEGQDHVSNPVNLEINLIKKSGFQPPPNPNIACLDKSKIEFPLILRKWKFGDYFRPLGMKDMKKLSDFFIDNKFSLPEKQDTWLVTTGRDIIWIVGHRIDDRFRILPETSEILMIKYNPPAF